MQAQVNLVLLKSLRSPASLAGLVVSLVGLLVMIGWLTDTPYLVRMHPALPAMKFNAGLGFFLSGLSICSIKSFNKKYSLLLIIPVLTIGLLTLIEYVLGMSLGIDELFFTESASVYTQIPGRMAENSAFCFLFVGVFLLLEVSAKRGTLLFVASVTLASLVLAQGLIALFGYILNLESVNHRGNLVGMALHTSICFSLLGFSTISFLRSAPTEKGGRSWLSLAVNFSLITFSLLFWVGAVINQTSVFLNQMALEERLITQNFSNELNIMIKSLQRLTARKAIGIYDATPDSFNRDAGNYVTDFPGLLSIGYANANGIVGSVNSSSQGLNFDGINLFETPYRDVVEKVRESHKLLIDEAFNLWDKTPGFVIFLPILKKDFLSGYIFGKIQYGNLFGQLLGGYYQENFAINVYRGEQLLFETDSRSLMEKNLRFGASFPVQFENIELSLMLVPRSSYLNKNFSFLPSIVLVAGVLLSFVATLLLIVTKRTYKQVEDLKVAELELATSKNLVKVGHARYSAIFDTVLDGIITIDDHGLMQDINRQAKTLFGYREEDLLGKNISMLMPEPYASSHDHFLKNYLKTGEAKVIGFSRTLKGLRSDGTIFPLKLGVTEMSIDGKRMFTGVVSDITIQENALKQLEVSNRELQSSNEALQQFAFIASHDLQEPLRVIASYAQLLEKRFKGRLDEKGDKFINYIVDGASRMQVMIKALLKYSRLNVDIPEFTSVPLLASLQSALSGLAEAIADSKCIVHYNPEQFPHVYGDVVQISQVFQNLISNAIKYRSELVPEIRINVSHSDTFVTVSIEDNGLGIDEQYFKRIFEIFQRLNSRQHSEGSGIGLSICRKIIEKHGGEMSVSSTPGTGSTFSFTLKFLALQK